MSDYGTIDILGLLSTTTGKVLVMNDETAILVDWYEWSNKPKSFVDMKFGGAWVEVGCDVQGLTASVGRSQTFEAVEAGIGRIVLDNRGGRFTDFVAGVPPINEYTEVRLRLRHPTIMPGVALREQILWSGRVDNWEQEWTKVTDEIVVEAVDLIGMIAEQGGALGWDTGELGDNASQRLTSMVRRVGLTNTSLYFDTGTVQLANPRLQSETVRDAAHTVELSDGGHFFAEVDWVGQPSFVYLDRDRFGRPPIQIESRPGQDAIPRFSDMCAQTLSEDALPYTDLAWSYRGWEIPSLVAVSNKSAPRERDPNGVELPPAWPDAGFIAPGKGRRHNILQFTNLEFYKSGDAEALGTLYASVLSRVRYDITMLELHPELDERLWDYACDLRQGDWVYIERHLQTDRILATCAIQGIEWSLDPVDAEGPRWKVTYKLSTISVTTNDIPVNELPPRPAGFPSLDPPLPPPLADIDLAVLGEEAQPDLGITDFTERGDPYFTFWLSMLDPEQPFTHQAFAWSSEYGIIELPLLVNNVYDGDGVRRQYGGTMLGPGDWIVYAVDGTRQSNQIPVKIDEWLPLTATSMSWAQDSSATVGYTDGRYPQVQPRVFVKGKTGEVELAVLGWAKVGDPETTIEMTVTFSTVGLPPDEYDVWLQDPNDYRRRSEIIPIMQVIVKTPMGPEPQLAAFDAADWDEKAWDKIGINWAPIPKAERYSIQYRLQTETTWRTTTEPVPYHLLDGGDTVSSQQNEKTWAVRVAAYVNGEMGEYGPTAYFATGYPYLIKRDPWAQSVVGGIYSNSQAFGLAVFGTDGTDWTQSVDPDADLFVGVDVTRIEFLDMVSRAIFYNWNASTNYNQGDIVSAETEVPGVWNVYRAVDAPIPAGGKHPRESGSGWKRNTNFYDRVYPQAWHEAEKIRWEPDDIGNLEVKYISHTVRESITTNPAVGPEEDATVFTFPFISGLDASRQDSLPNYGLICVGSWWGTAPVGQRPTLGGWIEYVQANATGYVHTYFPPKRPAKL
jgi:hypothetical protein